VTMWPPVALWLLSFTAPSGVKWCSYPARGWGTTAEYLCGLSPPRVAQLLGRVSTTQILPGMGVPHTQLKNT